MYVCIYVCTVICMYVSFSVSIEVCMYMNICTIGKKKCIYLCMYVCMYVLHTPVVCDFRLFLSVYLELQIFYLVVWPQ